MKTRPAAGQASDDRSRARSSSSSDTSTSDYSEISVAGQNDDADDDYPAVMDIVDANSCRSAMLRQARHLAAECKLRRMPLKDTAYAIKKALVARFGEEPFVMHRRELEHLLLSLNTTSTAPPPPPAAAAAAGAAAISAAATHAVSTPPSPVVVSQRSTFENVGHSAVASKASEASGPASLSLQNAVDSSSNVATNDNDAEVAILRWASGKDFIAFVETISEAIIADDAFAVASRNNPISHSGSTGNSTSSNSSRGNTFGGGHHYSGPKVGQRVTLRDVRRAYQRGLRLCHPDKQGLNASRSQVARAAAVFRLLQGRYEVLIATFAETGREEYTRSLSPWLG
jgi:hypothetical protein